MARLFQQHIIDLSLVVISSMFIGIAVGALTTRPKNVAVGWNQTAVLNCTNQGVDVFWFNTSCDFSVRPIHCPVSNLVFDSLQITTSVSSRMSISSGHTKDLLISPQYPFDATEYFCVDAASCCDASSAQLVVMGSDVSCNISNCCNFTVGDTISISCDFQYEGKMTHFVHCKANDIFLFSGSLNASIAATENLNSTRINCTAYFEPKQQPTSPYCANNTVLTEYVYMSSQITVNPTTTVPTTAAIPTTAPPPPPPTTTTTPPPPSCGQSYLMHIFEWLQAAIAISTFGFICACSFIIILTYELVKYPKSCLKLAVLISVIVILVLSAMLFIGCAIDLAYAKKHSCNFDVVNWLIGNLVIHVVITALALVVVVVIIIFMIKGDDSKWTLITVLILACLSWCCYAVTVAWSVVAGQNIKKILNKADVNDESPIWTWQVFLIVLGGSLVLAVIFLMLWFVVIHKRCNRVSGHKMNDS